MTYVYRRVLPRDLFNESKLHKCLGRLALAVHDGVDLAGNPCPRSLRIDHDGREFTVYQDPSDGSLFCENIRFYAGEIPIRLRLIYNSRAEYPLVHPSGEDEIAVFRDDGGLTDEFRQLCQKLGGETC